jgi:uncharacterized membrane protein
VTLSSAVASVQSSWNSIYCCGWSQLWRRKFKQSMPQ